MTVNLLTEGILVLGHQGGQPRIATALGLPWPNKGELVSVRVARRHPGDGDAPFVEIADGQWRIATPENPSRPRLTSTEQRTLLTESKPGPVAAPASGTALLQHCCASPAVTGGAADCQRRAVGSLP
ncbi:NaeI family type II restriction endonuclease [Streptomyces sp. NRRL S-1521]|uniref:NaeI family type II restriction endonuclease n=1 Tax=Streptomyces sp. NRRL S-1521 TaxID=1609100 RepID=UPI001F197E05|nr:NaeI family type II restriction endonuclease [Streptomyces sp. NRRL S-1521]